jgi:ribosomal protein L2
MASILAFQFIPFKNKVLSLVFFNNGSFTYYLTTDIHTLFSYSYHPAVRIKKLKKFKIKSFYLMLFQIKKLSFISCLELLPGLGAQYIRSPGTKGRIIKFDTTTHTVLVQLPSKLKKIFSYYSFTMLDAITLNLHKKCLNGKFGY